LQRENDEQHAYGGTVISVQDEERIKAVLYIAALTADEAVAQVFYREKPHSFGPDLAPDAHGFVWMPEEGSLNAFAHNASSELDSRISSRATAHRPSMQ
jgi:hypothetical protein